MIINKDYKKKWNLKNTWQRTVTEDLKKLGLKIKID